MTIAIASKEASTLRVCALHAFAYCRRLFYLEEVEELYTQDASVFAGRRLHEELGVTEEGEWDNHFLECADLGLRGRVDALRTCDGLTIPYEYKRGRCRRGDDKVPLPWDSDRLQVLAYACLLESVLGIVVPEGRIRYHADNVLVKVPVDDDGRSMVRSAIAAARELRESLRRPPVTDNERLCTRCSLAPVCLPEEARLANDRDREPVRYFPEDDDREVIHILEPGTRVGRSAARLKIDRRGELTEFVPMERLGQVVLHSFSQISTQALHLCMDRGVVVHFISGGGRYLGSFDARCGSIQRRIRQYAALTDAEFCLALARRLVATRGGTQRRFLMRARRGRADTACLDAAILQMKVLLKAVRGARSPETLLGLEGNLAALYFGALPNLLVDAVPPEIQFSGRSRRPPLDPVNALLSSGYSLLLKDVSNALLTVGLEPALGFYHRPRSQAAPLALDLMELFRVTLVDLPVIASINRLQWDVAEDFECRGQQVWLSQTGWKKLVTLYERRKAESWKHPALNYSLTYRRWFELEVRLLEKEWSGEAGLFACLALR